MIGRLIRNLVGFLICVVADVGLVVLTVALVIANYLACKSSFELLGFERQPLGTDELVGGFFGAFFHQATLVHFYALVLAVTMAVGLFLVFKLAFRLAALWEDRRAYLHAGDHPSAHAATRAILRDLIMLGIFLLPLAAAISWDVQLFRFRALTGALGIEDPTVASQMPGWHQQLQAHGAQFAWSLAGWGAWGYVAVTAMACLSLEYTVHKTQDYWTRLEDSCTALTQPAAPQEAPLLFYGYDHAGQPVFDPHAPLAYDTEGNPLRSPETAGVPSPAAVHEQQLDAGSQPSAPPSAPGERTDAVHGTVFDQPQAGERGTTVPETTHGPLFDPGLAHTNGAGQPGAANGASGPAASTQCPPTEWAAPRLARQPEDSPLHPVIGGADDDRVTLAAALADQRRYWVDPETHAVWDARFRQALLHEEAPQPTA